MVWLPPEYYEQWAPEGYVTPNAQDETPRPAPISPHVPDVRVLHEPPPVTWAWGESYKCCGYNMITGMQCAGAMERKGRRFRFEKRGRLWNRFICRRCGRRATDWNVNDGDN
jgi:hypothetical protein